MQASDPFGWVGSIIDGQFAVEALAGEGAFGVVYKARHLGFDAPVAVKCLKIPTGLSADQQEAFLAKFREEARLLHQLSRRTTGIVQALDIGAAAAPKGPWTPYIVMEWLDGETLEQDLRRRRADDLPPRSLDEAIRLLAPVASALAVAHDAHVSHRDVKPANLFLLGDRTKVLDFGLAKVFAETPTFADALVQTGRTFRAFTPQYGAPEQFSARFGATGPWTDVYAMALILVEVASGQPALSGSDVIQLFVASSDEAIRPGLRARGVSASAEIEAVVGRALAINPSQRFHHLGEMWAALEAAQRTSVVVVARDTLRAPAPAPDGSDCANGVHDAPFDLDALRVPPLPPPPSLPPVPPPSLPPPSLPPPTPMSSRWAPESSGVRGSVSPDRSSLRSRAMPPSEGGEHRICTVLFADLSEATGLSSRLDPEDVKDVVDRCYEALAEHVEQMHGIVERPIGGRVMAVFGVPRATDCDAERAILAALGAQAAIPRLALPRAARAARLAVRFGITTGRVFVGVGGSARQDLAVIGDAVDGAARLQQLAPRGAILIGRDTHRLVRGRFQVEPVEASAPASRAAPSGPEPPARGAAPPIYRVLGEAPLHRAFPPSDFHGLATRLVGRGAEMQRLCDLVETAFHERRPRLVTLVGPPGVGRTRMLAELSAGLGGGGHGTRAPSSARGLAGEEDGAPIVLSAPCSALAREASYSLAGALLRRWFGILEADPAQVILHKLRRGLRWLRLRTARARAAQGGGDDVAAAAALAGAPSSPTGTPAIPPRGPRSAPGCGRGAPSSARGVDEDMLDSGGPLSRPLEARGPEDLVARLSALLGARPAPAGLLDAAARGGAIARQRIAFALAQLLAFALDRAPLLILLDDVQWADDATLDLLEELVAQADGRPLCVVCAARPELYERRPDWGLGKEAHARVDALPLARRHTEEMIRDRLRLAREVRPELVRALAERAEGNPRSLDETLALLVDSGVIEACGGAWRVRAEAPGDLGLPPAVQVAVQARLDRLDADARALLAQAAVVGRTFWEGAVERLRNDAPPARSPMSSERILAELQDLDPPFSVRHPGVASTAELLARLCERGLIRLRAPATIPGEREYVFAEQATREVAYETLSLKVRRRMHLLVAGWLAQRAPGDAGAALVAYHYDRGGDLRAASAAYARAASYAAAAGESAEAMRHVARARALDDEREADEAL
ncbi:protein kinase [Sorangium cellulosum]|uniref:Protein kinase n=1 Tax=Sorangium cellulosum TaxID=56 RepID=A0A4P2PZ22_SORCE|nr:adenylate/guanylate cyclase domain-containing protein [Sorangium cellulosum]AUX22147.1 protein kinase [Sorangium cellulosum]